MDLNRREFMEWVAKGAAGVAAAAVVPDFAFAQDSDPQPKPPEGLEEMLKNQGVPVADEHEPDEIYAKKVWNYLEKKTGLHGRELAVKAIDYTAVGLFLRGLVQLARDESVGGGKLRASDYTAILTTLTLRYMFSNSHQREHLIHEELIINPAMVTGVSALTALGQSSLIDLEAITSAAKKESLSGQEKAFLAVTIPWFTGPLLSTVGSSGITHDLANELAYYLPNGGPRELDKTHNVQTALMAYTSNWQFAGFGDPPCLEMGYLVGLDGLAKLAPYLFPLTVIGAHYTLGHINKANGTADSTWDIIGHKDNWKLWARILKNSGVNGAKYISLMGKHQSKQGITYAPFGESIKIAKGFWNWMKGLPDPHQLSDMLKYEELTKFIDRDNIAEFLPDAEQHDAFGKMADIQSRIEAAKGKKGDLDKLADEAGSGIAGLLKTMFEKSGTYQSQRMEYTAEGYGKYFRMVKAWSQEVFSQERMKAHVGHSFGDILLVVPWQLAAVPHIGSVLEDLGKMLRGPDSKDPSEMEYSNIGDFVRDMTKIDMPMGAVNSIGSGFMDNLAGFMSFRKNYDVIVSYIMSMIGGGFTVIGNPAAAFNLFTLNQFPFPESVKRMHMHSKMAMTAFFYAEALKYAGVSRMIYDKANSTT